MNETLRIIRSRRSIRDFTDEQIGKKELDWIVEAGLYAPSHKGVQNLHHTVIQSKEMRQKVDDWIVDEVERSGDESVRKIVRRGSNSVFRNAPTVVIVSSEQNDRFGIVNAAAATENMLIAAESLGIGSCWIGILEMLAASPRIREYAKVLMLPEGYVPQFGINLGYKASSAPEAPERKPNLVSYI
jgi:nitroreductase